MLTQIDIERMPSYVIGLERGESRGLERGERLGLERGERLGLERGERLGLERGRAVEKRLIVRQLLARMDATEVAGLLGLSPDDISRIAAEDDGADSDRNRS
jgi:flagellar biosynthesis/type III secretory pathway protein FliH